MRLLVVSHYFWPEEFRVNELVAWLTAHGHSVTVLTGRPNYPTGSIFPQYRQAPQEFRNYAGAEVLRIPLRPRGSGSLSLMLSYWSFVFWGCLLGPWLLRGRTFDAIFVFEASPITSALPAILFKWIKRAPLALWVLDLWPDTLSAVGALRARVGLNAVGQLVSFIYRHCDLILAQSRGFFGPIERWSGDASKTRYFPQWADGVFDAGVVAPAPEAQAQAGAFNLMFAGNLGEAQDLPAVLEAAALLKHRSDIRWLIVGDGRAAEEVRRAIHRLGLEQSVILLGRHPLERMPAFFAVADAMLVSLKAEPIFAMTVPGKVQSYLAAGKPIVAMLDGEGAQVVIDAEAGFACPAGDASALARCVERMADLPRAERERLGRAGQAYARERFNIDRLMQSLVCWLDGMRREMSV